MTSPLPSIPPKRDLAQQLRDAIRSSGHSQHKLAQLSGVASGSISRFLAGDRDLGISSAGRLAEVLKLRLVEVGRAPRRGRPSKLRPSVGDVHEVEPEEPGSYRFANGSEIVIAPTDSETLPVSEDHQ